MHEDHRNLSARKQLCFTVLFSEDPTSIRAWSALEAHDHCGPGIAATALERGRAR